MSAPEWTKYYQPGVPAEIELPTESLVSLIETAVREAGSKPATEFFGRRTSYAELGDQINRAAEGLRRLGVRAGDRVALVLPNCPQHVVAFYAVLRLGAVVVEHNPLYTVPELRHMFEDHSARVAIVWDAAVAKLQHQPRDIPLEHIISVNLLRAMPKVMNFALHLPVPSLRANKAKLTKRVRGTITWESLLENQPVNDAHPRPGVHDLAAILYTSGTTSAPKGAMLTHYSIFANARQSEAWMIETEKGKEVFYAILPMFHALGMMVFLAFCPLIQGHSVLFPAFEVDLVMNAVKKTPPTVFIAVPPIYDRTAERAIETGTSLLAAKFCLSGAMSLPPATAERWEGLTGGLLIEGYGMTEGSPILVGNPVYPTRRIGTIGIPFPSTLIKVVDPDNPTQEVPKGERGELLAKGPQIFAGYWNNPAETERTLLPGGWLRTGDLVEVDEDDYITVVDRVKELIITGGFNVSPSEVEATLRSHPDIKDAAVVGLPLASGGERVVAAVVLNDSAVFDEDALRLYCRKLITPYKVPRMIVAVDEFPMSMLGKVLRKEIREQLIRAGN
ncbi:MAG: AMP-binding protein [Propionibacteriaceae bacterium]|jgi:long-chain acyl-CoA synthetase|nr:AMP-binding protein [Propionibacteriaceae bacterium]